MPRVEDLTGANPRRARSDDDGHGAAAVEYAVLCDRGDPSGPWILDALRRRGIGSCRLVTTEELVYSTRVIHRMTPAGGTTTEVTLTDGAVFGPHLRGLVNRATAVPSEHLARASPEDREYAVQEVYALLMSVLRSLPGVVVNRADARGLAGPWLQPAEWLVEAGRVGLAGVGFRSGSKAADHSGFPRAVYVVGDRVIASSPCPGHVEEGSRALARRLGLGLVRLNFVEVAGRWLLTGAAAVPDLRAGGDRLADALTEVLLSPPDERDVVGGTP